MVCTLYYDVEKDDYSVINKDGYLTEDFIYKPKSVVRSS